MEDKKDMKYRAILNFDYARTRAQDDKQEWSSENSASEKLKCALVQLGWNWTETSAFELQTENISLIWRGVELLDRQGTAPGRLSALTFVLQGGAPKTPSSLKNMPDALAEVEAKPLSKELPSLPPSGHRRQQAAY